MLPTFQMPLEQLLKATSFSLPLLEQILDPVLRGFLPTAGSYRSLNLWATFCVCARLQRFFANMSLFFFLKMSLEYHRAAYW